MTPPVIPSTPYVRPSQFDTYRVKVLLSSSDMPSLEAASTRLGQDRKFEKAFPHLFGGNHGR